MHITRFRHHHMMRKISPAALIIAGAALALTSPTVRKGIRSAAILTTRGVLSVGEQIKNAGYRVQEEFEDIVADAKNSPAISSSIRSNISDLHEETKTRLRGAAVATTQGMLAISDTAKGVVHNISDNFQEIVQEAKTKKMGISNIPAEHEVNLDNHNG